MWKMLFISCNNNIYFPSKSNFQKWTLKKLEKNLLDVSVPKITAEEIIKEVKKICIKGNIKLDVEFTKHPKHAIELAKGAKNK